jgi:hypothetical protein
MNGTFTSYAAVLMMPAGQMAQQRTSALNDRRDDSIVRERAPDFPG